MNAWYIRVSHPDRLAASAAPPLPDFTAPLNRHVHDAIDVIVALIVGDYDNVLRLSRRRSTRLLFGARRCFDVVSAFVSSQTSAMSNLF